MSELRRIYLDNAATSWPKPEAVYAAVDRYLRESGAPSGRSAYSQAAQVQRTIDSARAALARLIGAPDARHIVFALNGTEALNLAIHGLLRPGDHAVCTDADHNSVLRPMSHLEEYAQVEVTRVRCNSFGLVDPDDIRRALKPNTRLVAMLHASNVTGVIQPVAAVGQIVRQHGRARFLVDAAQTVGHCAVSVSELDVDFLAAPAHKGLRAPLGTGFLYIRPGKEAEMLPIQQGGTGTRSEQDRHPDDLPEKFEAGDLNVPGLVGLAAALAWLEERGLTSIVSHEQQLAARLRNGLRTIAGVTVHTPPESVCAVGVVSISIEGYDPQEAAAALDAAFGVQVRAGLHCAPRLHRTLGTLERGGAVRFSLGAFNTQQDVDTALAAVAQLAAGK